MSSFHSDTKGTYATVYAGVVHSFRPTAKVGRKRELDFKKFLNKPYKSF